MSNFLTVYINHCEFFLMSFLESFVTCNALTISCVASVNIFSVRLRILFFLFLSSIIGKNVVTSQLVHLVFFNVFFVFLFFFSFYHDFLRPNYLNQIYISIYILISFLAYIPITVYHSHYL